MPRQYMLLQFYLCVNQSICPNGIYVKYHVAKNSILTVCWSIVLLFLHQTSWKNSDPSEGYRYRLAKNIHNLLPIHSIIWKQNKILTIRHTHI